MLLRTAVGSRLGLEKPWITSSKTMLSAEGDFLSSNVDLLQFLWFPFAFYSSIEWYMLQLLVRLHWLESIKSDINIDI